MRYLLLLLLVGTGVLLAQDGLPDFEDFGDVDAGAASGTFTGTRPSGDGDDGTRDKSMGFGKKAQENANSNRRLQEARKKAVEKVENSVPEPDAQLDFDEAAGLGYYYLETGATGRAAEYLDAAAGVIDTYDYESVYGLFTLYSLLAEQASNGGDYDLAEAAWSKAQGITASFFSGDPAAEDAYDMHEELGYAYYELGWNGLAAEHFHDALEFQPENAYVAYLVASCLALEGRNDGALAYLEYALLLDLLDDPEVDLAADADLDGIRDSAAYNELRNTYNF